MKTNFGLAGNKKIFKGVEQFDEERINLTADSEYLPGNVNSWHTAPLRLFLAVLCPCPRITKNVIIQ